MLRAALSKRLRPVALKFLLPTPAHLERNHIRPGSDELKLLRAAIAENYHVGWRDESNYSSQAHEADLNAHLHLRLERDRRMIIPWLDTARRLEGQRILEIGCGTGSSTLALAEQGARVTGIDVDDGALCVARRRCEIYGVHAELRRVNANALASEFRPGEFDQIIFFACLEHMTMTERLSSLQHAWHMLSPAGLLAVIGTPNRLWHFDGHTSFLPFFHWLPNDLAFRYSSFSARENFRELYRTYDASSKEHFLRRGRGLSFHEFEIAMARPVAELKVVSSLSSFQGVRFTLRRTALDRRYKRCLQKIAPHIHEGFLDEHLNLILQREERSDQRMAVPDTRSGRFRECNPDSGA